MKELFPWFSRQLLAVLPFEEYFQITGTASEDLGVVLDEKAVFQAQSTRLKNVWLAGPEFDRGLELLSQLATEWRLLDILTEVRAKETHRDRAVHPAGNGRNMDLPK
jgi:hypothetical protein